MVGIFNIYGCGISFGPSLTAMRYVMYFRFRWWRVSKQCRE